MEISTIGKVAGSESCKRKGRSSASFSAYEAWFLHQLVTSLTQHDQPRLRELCMNEAELHKLLRKTQSLHKRSENASERGVQSVSVEVKRAIVRAYSEAEGEHYAVDLAERYGLTIGQVRRICRQWRDRHGLLGRVPRQLTPSEKALVDEYIAVRGRGEMHNGKFAQMVRVHGVGYDRGMFLCRRAWQRQMRVEAAE